MSQSSNPSSHAESVMPEDPKSTQRLPTCFNCGYPYRPGELACGHCGIVFSGVGRTKTMGAFKPGDLDRVRRVGDVVVHQTCAITVNVGSEHMILPNTDTIVLGRDTKIPHAVQPDADLTPYGAHENGVSHLHLKIIRKGDMIYVADLGSTNGTFLNGIRLMPKQERVLRNGDELILGRLRLHVKFTK